ncbi:MAG: hypothetical protein ACT4PJ_16730 [Gemmatimonadaceae bacterium]
MFVSFAHHARGLEVREEAIEQMRVAEELKRRLALRLAHRRRRGRDRCERRGDLLRNEGFEREDERADVVLDEILADPELLRGLRDEEPASACGVEVERVDVHGVAALHEQIHPERIGREILRQPAHPIGPIADRGGHLIAAPLEREREHRRRRDGRRDRAVRH